MLTTAQVMETSVTENSLSEDCSHLDDHTRQTIDAIYHDINSGPYRSIYLYIDLSIYRSIYLNLLHVICFCFVFCVFFLGGGIFSRKGKQ